MGSAFFGLLMQREINNRSNRTSSCGLSHNGRLDEHMHIQIKNHLLFKIEPSLKSSSMSGKPIDFAYSKSHCIRDLIKYQLRSNYVHRT